jgi:S1-C subfamily serine protease
VSKPMGSASAYVVTNFHVIDGCNGVRVRYPVYQPVNAYIRAADPSKMILLFCLQNCLRVVFLAFV